VYNLLAISGLVTVSFLAGLFGNPDAEAQELELARNGQTDYAIIQSAKPTPAEKLAVEDLSAYLQKIAGSRFAVVSETNAVLPPHAIYVGWTDFARKQGLDLAALGDEEWIIKSFGKNLVLAGGRPRGTLYAVYEFLEKQVGCHWFDEFTETIPARPDLTLKKMNIRGQPAFWDRRIYTAADIGIDTERFRFRNKESTSAFGSGSVYGAPNGCHTFYYYSKEWPANHPEYLALNEAGVRVVSSNGVGPGQICLTHPEVRKLMLKQLKGFIAKDREAAAASGCQPPRIYAVEPNDNELVCQCPECKAFCEREGSPSGPLVDLLNSLADGIKAEYPDVLVETFAYQTTLKPPRTIRSRANVMIRVAQLNAEWPPPKNKRDDHPDLFRPMTHPVNRGPCKTLAGWSKIAQHLAVWDYWILYSFNYEDIPSPYVNLRCLQPDLKLFHDSNVEMMFVECEKSETTSFFALKRWLGLKLMQNPDQDPASLIKTFMDGFYGPAAGKMAEYLNYMEGRIAATPAMSAAIQTFQRPYLTLEFYKTCHRLLDEAEALCGPNAAALLNVQRERIPVDGGLYGMWEQVAKQLAAGQAMPWDREKILQRYEATRLAQMEARRSKDKLQEGKDDLQKELKKMREIPLIKKRKAAKPPALRIPRLTDEIAASDPSKVN